ncbi:MAG: 16S rRNA (cytosine(1402)-N(4))-methyltransferase RsmH [Bacteroidales bacterium]|jgi:16S rRNA (cytosine1402-N4)-methyltransferase|nr:16S rRNA (cytosine(1402)-N(4))-methyltransferase RsmH [Bacteroidales bacterium]MBQ2397838.1 16S rRNA (cytosine(1402)-N(4))-methyltransferase RsmH [Bacteroidales bacterium]MED9962826.1 16S rRNA (cytosine(1402)-N(4))-methyltransferase RsmH [Bacteroidales bacterium]MEE0267124.1 16S rRNA (cytosine(1402)-N(4))-methyltransferase RsmH [Bacteroidales bacterium]MEE1302059.1 16S rRNA (cytosine(1402)-N(4))-methyltransferase RsmH [Bacteroidales bacterium]
MQEEQYHVPVMLEECIEGLNIKPDGIYIDLTFGGGGHSKAILQRLSSEGSLYAFDQDSDAVKNALDDDRFTMIEDNFSNLTNQLKLYRVTQVDGILADLGISSYQIDCAERGFSTRFDAELDLRMNRKQVLTAKDVVNTYSLEQLKKIFANYGELSNAYQIAKRIESSQIEGISTTNQLKEILQPLAQRGKENKFFAQVFQALRIEVNGEIDVLQKMLEQTSPLLKQGGRLVVMSYHSLEDRLVKNYIKTGNCEGKIEKDFFGNLLNDLEAVNRKPITASEQELIRNPRSRSAKLRIAQKK